MKELDGQSEDTCCTSGPSGAGMGSGHDTQERVGGEANGGRMRVLHRRGAGMGSAVRRERSWRRRADSVTGATRGRRPWEGAASLSGRW